MTGKLGAVKITGARGSIPLVLLSLQSSATCSPQSGSHRVPRRVPSAPALSGRCWRIRLRAARLRGRVRIVLSAPNTRRVLCADLTCRRHVPKRLSNPTTLRSTCCVRNNPAEAASLVQVATAVASATPLRAVTHSKQQAPHESQARWVQCPCTRRSNSWRGTNA